MSASDGPVTSWANDLACFVAASGLDQLVRRVITLDEVDSTQDIARAESSAGPGVLVIAERQTRGRGRLGRPWHHRPGLGLAFSLTLDAAKRSSALVSIASGLAIALGSERVVSGPARLGIKWPNDVVEPRGSLERKLAGVLIEQAGSILVVGIGINVAHASEDLAPELRSIATSLAMICGTTPSRLRVLEHVLVELDRCLRWPEATLTKEWLARDVLVGTRREYQCGPDRYAGEVLAIDPLRAIRLRTTQGDIDLPAATSTLVKPS